MMTDQQLQSLRNMGNEFEDAADEIDALRVDADRYRWLRADAYECVVPHGNQVRGSRTGWITHIHPGSSFDSAIDAARTQGDKS